jgi:chromosome condensin MukBEF ATPase and DNA-binding subunit MukB
MCGEVETKVLANVSFVIAKDVLAAKYKVIHKHIRRTSNPTGWDFPSLNSLSESKLCFLVN